MPINVLAIIPAVQLMVVLLVIAEEGIARWPTARRWERVKITFAYVFTLSGIAICVALAALPFMPK